MSSVAVVGAGTAGPAAALNIVRRLPGSTVRLFDRAKQPAAVGAGIGIQPIGMSALKKLGLLEPVQEHGARVNGIRTHAEWLGRRWPVLDINYSRLDDRLYGLGLHRGVLFSVLMNACEAESAIDLAFGTDVCEVDQQHGDSVTLRTDTGRAVGSYDLVVLADGQRSHLRRAVGFREPQSYAYGALFALLPDPTQVFPDELRQVHAGPGCHTTLGFLPTGRAWGGDDTLHSTLYFNLRHDEYQSWKSAGLEAWKAQLCKTMPEAAPLIMEQLVSVDQVAHASYADGTARKFHRGRVALIGDAASCKSPQLGQGANVALIDAEKLVDCLVEGGTSVPDALAQYTTTRWTHTMYYALLSKLLTPIFASKSMTIQAARNLFLYPLCHTPVLTRFMHTVLVGAQKPGVNPWNTLPEDEWMGFLSSAQRDREG